MKRNGLYTLIALAVILSSLLGACSTPAAPTTAPTLPAATNPPAATSAPAATVAPAATKAPATQAPATVAPAKVYKVVYWQHSPWIRGAAFPAAAQNDIIRQYILKNYGLDIEIQFAPAEGGDAKLNAMIASGEMPDMIQAYWTVGSSIVNQFVTQGVLLPLDDSMNKVPKIWDAMPKGSWQYLQTGGKTWGVAPIGDPQKDILWIRQDWLDKLGLKKPTTVEEAAQVAIAFATKDPDGNGKNDTFGITAFPYGNSITGRMDGLFAPFGAQPGSIRMLVQNGKVVLDGLAPEGKAALQYLNSLIKAGAVDPDWVTNTQEQWRAAIAKGKVGMTTGQFQFLRELDGQDTLGKDIKASSPNAKWEMVGALKGPYGTYSDWQEDYIGNSFWLTRSADKEPGKKDAIIKFLADAMDPASATYRMLVWGIPGQQFEADAQGNVVKRITQPTENQYLSYYRYWRAGNDEYMRASWPDLPWMRTNWLFTGGQPQITGHYEKLVAANPALPDLTTYIKEMSIKFAMGDVAFTEWDNFVTTALTKYKGQEIVDDATKQLTALGIIK